MIKKKELSKKNYKIIIIKRTKNRNEGQQDMFLIKAIYWLMKFTIKLQKKKENDYDDVLFSICLRIKAETVSYLLAEILLSRRVRIIKKKQQILANTNSSGKLILFCWQSRSNLMNPSILLSSKSLAIENKEQKKNSYQRHQWKEGEGIDPEQSNWTGNWHPVIWYDYLRNEKKWRKQIPPISRHSNGEGVPLSIL